jgi:DnaJ-class molecular chaperone
MAACTDCDGRGYVFRRILWACRSCMGVGQKLIPKADPAKILMADKS